MATTSAVIEMMIKHEEALAALYRAYAQRFAGMRQFWSQLADEEVQHSGWLSALMQKQNLPGIRLNTERFPEQAMRTALQFVCREVGKINNPEMTERTALAVAFNIEAAMIDKSFFMVLESDLVEQRQRLKELQDQTQDHVNRVRASLQNYRAQ